LVPRQSSSGGKERLGRITRQGDPYIRRLLVIGATAVLRFSHKSNAASTQWARQLLERKPGKVAAVALANKMARIAWALMTKDTSFRSAMS
ncbi:transposase, partial [Agrobacterium vitis]